MDKVTNGLLIFGLIAAARQRWPRLDGLVIWAIALVSGVGLSFLEGDLGVGPRKLILDGLMIGLGAIGVAGGGSYIAGKMGGVTALGPVLGAGSGQTTTATVTKTEAGEDVHQTSGGSS